MRLAIVTNPTTFQWSPLAFGTLGGGEEGVVCLARALAARGHDVTVVYDGDACEPDGVRYVPRGTALDADVAIYANCPELLGAVGAPRTVGWTYQARPQPAALQHARVVACSPTLARTLASLHPALEARLVVLPYGWDGDPVVAGPVTRDPALVLHTASPDRGLVTLLRLWPEVLRHRPGTRLQIAYGWDLYLACGGSRALKAEVDALLRALPEGAATMARLSAVEMVAAYRTAGIWAYWCEGGEQFGISGVKAQMAGAVPVVRPWGALHDTVWSGLKADTREAFVAAMVRALDQEEQARLRAAIAPMAPTWATVAEAWEQLLHEVLAEAAPPASASRLTQVPGTPTQLVPDPAAVAPGAVAQLVQQWLHAHQPRAPWIDPALGLGAPLPATPDAWCLGWRLEDDPEPIATQEWTRVVPAGARVCALLSVGAWRAGRRRRALLRRDLHEVLGGQHDLQIQVSPIDPAGDAICAAWFTFAPGALGHRDVQRVRTTAVPRQSLSVCLIAPPVMPDAPLLRALRSVEPIADEVVIALNGTALEADVPGMDVAAVLDAWGRRTGIPTQVVAGTSPRWCYDCQRQHDVGEMAPGHRLAGFETPRNESIAPASGDWVLWIDADEQLCEPERLRKYLRPNCYAGYGIPQDHYSSDPPEAFKRDLPVRLFRRARERDAAWITLGPHAWPTYDPGLTVRFAGIVHEHPGHAPLYSEGLGPVVLLSDVWLAHEGYLTEPKRRRRFLRNWPLMVADRQKYPDRRLGQFLWLRDLSHHVRYLLETTRGQVTPDVVSYAEEAVRLFEAAFTRQVDPFFADAVTYVGCCYEVLQRGLQAEVRVVLTQPALGGQPVVAQFAGRLGDAAQVRQLIEAHLHGVEQWAGPWA